MKTRRKTAGGAASVFGLRRRGEAAGLVCSAEEKQKPKSKEEPRGWFGWVEKIRGESGDAEEAALAAGLWLISLTAAARGAGVRPGEGGEEK